MTTTGVLGALASRYGSITLGAAMPVSIGGQAPAVGSTSGKQPATGTGKVIKPRKGS